MKSKEINSHQCGYHPFPGAQMELEGEERGWLPSLLFELGYPSSPTLGLWSSWFLGLGLQDLHQQLHGPQAFGLGLNYALGFLVSPACRLQIV